MLPIGAKCTSISMYTYRHNELDEAFRERRPPWTRQIIKTHIVQYGQYALMNEGP